MHHGWWAKARRGGVVYQVSQGTAVEYIAIDVRIPAHLRRSSEQFGNRTKALFVLVTLLFDSTPHFTYLPGTRKRYDLLLFLEDETVSLRNPKDERQNSGSDESMVSRTGLTRGIWWHHHLNAKRERGRLEHLGVGPIGADENLERCGASARRHAAEHAYDGASQSVDTPAAHRTCNGRTPSPLLLYPMMRFRGRLSPWRIS